MHSTVKRSMPTYLLDICEQDSVMLEDYKNESVFLKNLSTRFSKDLIYTYIGK